MLTHWGCNGGKSAVAAARYSRSFFLISREATPYYIGLGGCAYGVGATPGVMDSLEGGL